MNTITAPLKDKTFYTGIVLFSIALLTFGLTMFLGENQNDLFTASFIITFSLFWLYFFIVLGANKNNYGKRLRFGNLRHNILLLQLGNLSAYTLNQNLTVFHDSTDWLVGFLFFYHLALLVYCFRLEEEPDSINYTIFLTLVAGSVFHFYETLFLLPVYPIMLISFWFFGVSLVALIPFWHLLMGIHIIRRYMRLAADSYRPLLIGGLAIPLVMIGLYTARWYHLKTEMTMPFTQAKNPLDEKLYPDWVEAAQVLQDDAITKRILKAGSVFQTADQFASFDGFNIMNERRQHDPFVVIATFFGQNDLSRLISNDDRVRLLNTLYDQRHLTARKLWRSDHLVTESVKTEIRLFPAYRMAYTEKTIVIENQQHERRWGGQEEALYTFHVPEGAVVSSASLWIEGVEQEAYLTTRSKADSAYTTIVGREARDPLLVHWQEGNTVTARIFPVMAGETRQFKIGFTSLLKTEEDELVYENIDFEGPYWQLAQEQITVVTTGDVAEMQIPWRFTEEGNTWSYAGRYLSDWGMRFAAPALAKDIFSFNGRSFQLQQARRTAQAFNPKTVYLDINAAWNKSDLNDLWEMVQDKKVYVYTNRMEEVTTANHKRLFNYLLNRRFSLFPLFQIAEPEKALFISTYSRLTPNLSDMEESQFAQELNTYMQSSNSQIRFYNLGDELSPYLRSLRDLRMFNYTEGDFNQLINILEENVFPVNQENPTTVANYYAQLLISEVTSSGEGAAPDHLMRLYAYNDLLKKIGKDYFNKDLIADQLIEQAAEAHIVTPVSSMIVLETQADYDRFGIEKSRNSLGNASIKGSGSVPEPHEWLLLLLSLLLMVYFWKKDGVQVI